jgi:signal transduction histidine kinase
VIAARADRPIRVTLSRKVSLAACVVVAALIGFFLLELNREQRALLFDVARSQARVAADLLRASLEDPRLGDDPAALQALADRLRAASRDGSASAGRQAHPEAGLDFLVLDAAGVVIAARTSELVGSRFRDDPGGAIARTLADGQAREVVSDGPTRALWVVTPLKIESRKARVLLVRVLPDDAARRAQTLAREVAAEALVIAIPALLLLIWAMRRFLLRPVQLLKAGAAAWKRGMLSHRVLFPGRDELGELRDAFNEMAATLEAQHEDLARKQAELEQSLRHARETQARLVQSEKLASLGTLAAGVAHELNQPLMLIRGYAQRLLGGDHGLDAMAREAIGAIEEETGRMTKIIRHLKDFSRRSNVESQAVDLNATLQRGLALVSERLDGRHVTLSLHLDPNLPRIWGDPIQLTQVFVNIIVNALDALDEVGGGEVTITSAPRGADTVLVSVADTGPGIEPAILPRIFDPFFTTKPVGTGTGLGLSIALGLVQAHGGQITVDSHPGRGCRFTVSLPVGGATCDATRADPGR